MATKNKSRSSRRNKKRRNPDSGSKPQAAITRVDDSGFLSGSDERNTPSPQKPDSLSGESTNSFIQFTAEPMESESGQGLAPTSVIMSGSSNQKAAITTIHMSNQGALRDKLHQGDVIFKTVEDFVERYVENPEKRRPIRKILVATNGIGAVRAILSIRRLLMQLFRDDRIIKFICLTTAHEIESNSEYIKMADFIVFSPAGSNRNNYANVNEIVSHAVEQQVDAVWAGWGHASENPELPKQLAEKNIVFIGPPSSAMFSLGDKIASTIIAQTVGIPTIEWSGSGICMDVSNRKEGEHVDVPKDLFMKATVSNYKEGLEALSKHKIGFPLMIKASEGGGGKGIRKCTAVEQFKDAFEEVVQELPGSPVFLMKCVENARHIEVQLIADRYENVIPVFTRDCSIQRRCQKIIEEAPASVAPKSVLRAMQEDAVRIAKLVGYESAGTVEYMYLPDEDRYYFLELNPRLQVEHPCTEMIASINIPAIQIQIAMGLPLHRITDIRLFFGLDRYGTSPLPEDTVLTDTEYSVIAARITSEDPDDSFRPSTGSVEVLNFRSAQDVWGYFSVSSGSKVHEFADSQFGHLFARGRTRDDAISTMLIALKELELRATFASQVSYLVDLLMEPDFANNKFNTQWLDQRIAKKIKQKVDLPMSEIIAISAAVIGHSRVTNVFDSFKESIERGQVLPPTDLTETFLFDLVKDLKIYSVTVTRSAPLTFVVSLNGATTTVQIVLTGNGQLLATHNKNVFPCKLEETTDTFKVTIGRSIIVFEKDNDPSVLKSPYTGKMLSYKKENNDWLDVGEIYATVESMKLVFNVEVKKAPGRLMRVANEGDLLYPGSVIARLCDQTDSEKYRPQPFTDAFAEWLEPTEEKNSNPNKQFNNLLQKCKNILHGSIPIGGEKEIQDTFAELFKNYLLADNLANVILEPIVEHYAQSVSEPYQTQLVSGVRSSNVDAANLMNLITKSKVNTEEAWKVREKCEQFLGGNRGYASHVLNELLGEYITCEKYFEGKVYDDAVADIKEDFQDGEAVVGVIYSHTQLKAKNKLLTVLLSTVKKHALRFVPYLLDSLREIGNLLHTNEISRMASEILYLNSSIMYRMNLVDAKKVNLQDRVADVISGLNTPTSATWKVLHELFFNKDVGSLAIRKYVENFLQVDENVKESTIEVTGIGASVEITDFTFSKASSKSHYKIPMDNYAVLSVIRVSLPQSQLAASLTDGALLSALIKHYNGFIRNGTRIPMRVVVLVNVTGYVTAPGQTTSDHIDELPSLSEEDEKLVHEAEKASGALRESITSKLPTLDIATQVIVCLPDKPLAQLDMIDVERLEMWRLPVSAVRASMRLSSVHAYQYDDADQKFAKIFVRQGLSLPSATAEGLKKDVVTAMSSALDNSCTATNVIMNNNKKKTFVGNHVFLHISCPSISETLAASAEYEQILNDGIRTEISNQQDILYKHHITEVEVVYGKISQGQQVNIRVKFLDDTGVTTELGIYEEHSVLNSHNRTIAVKFLSQGLYGKTLQPHSAITKIEKKRAATRVNGTTYVYDYPSLFGRACYNAWKKFEQDSQDDVNFEMLLSQLPSDKLAAYKAGLWRNFLTIEEIALQNGEYVTITNEPELKKRAENGLNECGMVAWVLTLFTPERPTGYQSVLISNDITVQSGSFATGEDALYAHASEYARKKRLPRVNVSCNSGARIGLADEIANLIRVQLKDENSPERGFEYLYVDAADKTKVEGQIVYDELANGRLRVKAVIGKNSDKIGVENLQGSGLIAGETSLAYNEIPTYCLVTGRSVGIGAYTARLAHRVVQSRNSHIILTGAPALNTLLGKEVYTSNNQLGGIEIMHKNGVSHAVVEDDLQGIVQLVKWMSYLPTKVNNFPFVQPFGIDSEARSVEMPTASECVANRPYDVRDLIDSKNFENRQGICDTGSFDEVMSDWAKSIVAGRARMGGIPIGVVSSELRSCETIIPADPAVEGSKAQTLQRAGQVWYPDSAYKTAEAINDFNREGLPLLFIASLRGFSGGQRDMYEMVLKFGAQIVDALCQYKMPVIVYIPSGGELRGGAWVVIDSKINPGFIHMVADKESRGGILEPNAIVGIKFREPKLLALLKRSDKVMKKLNDELSTAQASKSPEVSSIQQKMNERGEELRKTYRSATVEFADMHDRSDRMKAVGAVEHVTSLAESRNLFIRIFRNEIVKVGMAERYLKLNEKLSRQKAYEWVQEKLGDLVAPSVDLDKQYENMQSYIQNSFAEQLRHVYTQELERIQAALKHAIGCADSELLALNQ